MPKTDTILSAKALRYFLQLVDTMNYTQAAQLLGITQPALTQQIKKLERTIGTPLFGQMGKKIYLTEAGKQMKTAAEELLETINSVVDGIQEFTQDDKGTIVIGVLESIDISVFREFMVQFNQKYPNIILNLISLNRQDLWQRLDKNTLDLAFMYLPDITKHDEINLLHQYEHETFYKDRVVVLTHDPEMKDQELTSANMAKHKWVTYPENFYLSQLVKGTMNRNHQLEIPLSFSDSDSLVKTAQETDLDTFVSQSYYEIHKDKIKLTPCYLKNHKSFEISMVYRKGKMEIPRIENFMKEWNKFLENRDYSSRLE